MQVVRGKTIPLAKMLSSVAVSQAVLTAIYLTAASVSTLAFTFKSIFIRKCIKKVSNKLEELKL